LISLDFFIFVSASIGTRNGRHRRLTGAVAPN